MNRIPFFLLLLILWLHAATLAHAATFAERVVERAKLEAINHVDYDASYYVLPFPAGDLPADKGCCTDLVIRAYRNAGIDLQKEVHEDYRQHPADYPVSGPEELTHRRCRNLLVWFRRHAEERPAGLEPEQLKDCRPGDIVFINFERFNARYPDHIAVVSERPFLDGVPYVYDNLGPEAAERLLTSFPIVHSRFRWKDDKALEPIAPRYAQPKTQPASAPVTVAGEKPTPMPRSTPVEVSLEIDPPQESSRWIINRHLPSSN